MESTVHIRRRSVVLTFRVATSFKDAYAEKTVDVDTGGEEWEPGTEVKNVTPLTLLSTNLWFGRMDTFIQYYYLRRSFTNERKQIFSFFPFK